MGLKEIISERVQARPGGQGWTDEQMVMSLALLNLAGGDCVEDAESLEGDEGFCRVLREVEEAGLEEAMAERQGTDNAISNGGAGVSGAVSRRRARETASASYGLHSFGQEALAGLVLANADLSREFNACSGEDGDLGYGCTIVETHKRSSVLLQEPQAYQP